MCTNCEEENEQGKLKVMFKSDWTLSLVEHVHHGKNAKEIANRITNLLEIYFKLYHLAKKSKEDQKEEETKSERPKKAWLKQAPSSSKEPAEEEERGESDEPKDEPKGGNLKNPWTSWKNSWSNWRSWNWDKDTLVGAWACLTVLTPPSGLFLNDQSYR